MKLISIPTLKLAFGKFIMIIISKRRIRPNMLKFQLSSVICKILEATVVFTISGMVIIQSYVPI